MLGVKYHEKIGFCRPICRNITGGGGFVMFSPTHFLDFYLIKRDLLIVPVLNVEEQHHTAVFVSS